MSINMRVNQVNEANKYEWGNHKSRDRNNPRLIRHPNHPGYWENIFMKPTISSSHFEFSFKIGNVKCQHQLGVCVEGFPRGGGGNRYPVLASKKYTQPNWSLFNEPERSNTVVKCVVDKNAGSITWSQNGKEVKVENNVTFPQTLVIASGLAHTVTFELTEFFDHEKYDAMMKKENKKKEKEKKKKKEAMEKAESKLFSFLDDNGLSRYYDPMKSDDVKYEDLGIFLEDPESLEDYIPKKFHRNKFLKSLKKEKEREKGGKDKIAGEYNWKGKSIMIKENFAYFEDRRYEFEKLTCSVYNINISGDVYVFIWDDEDEMLRVVRTKGKYEFIKRISALAGEDQISGEYDWNGKSLDIKKKNCYFESGRYSFEKVASTVYTVQMDEKKFVFNWDNEDTVLGVVQVEGDMFFERIDKKVFLKNIE